MKRTITLFMWGYQPHFRIAMTLRARRVFERVGADIEPKALLVGIRDPQEASGHSVCVEPEDEEWDPGLFFPCAARASEIAQDHPDQSLIYGDEPRMRDKPENIRRKSVQQAVTEVLQDWDRQHGTVSFSGAAMRVGAYHVIPILQLPSSEFWMLPRLSSPIRWGEFSSSPGFLESVVHGLLIEAATALQLPEPGRYFQTLETDPTSLLREAGDRFCSAITLATGDVSLQGVFEALNEISSLRYEGAASRGQILFAPKESAAVTVRLKLSEPLDLREPKLARKAVEMSDRDLCCICNGEDGISGLGNLNDPEAEDVMRVEFAGHYRWDLYHKERLVMKVAYGVPRLPTARLKELELKANVRRISHRQRHNR